jgi:hypothetical protein
VQIRVGLQDLNRRVHTVSTGQEPYLSRRAFCSPCLACQLLSTPTGASEAHHMSIARQTRRITRLAMVRLHSDCMPPSSCVLVAAVCTRRTVPTTCPVVKGLRKSWCRRQNPLRLRTCKGSPVPWREGLAGAGACGGARARRVESTEHETQHAGVCDAVRNNRCNAIANA